MGGTVYAVFLVRVTQSFVFLTAGLPDLSSPQYSLISTPTENVRFRQTDFALW